MRPSTLSARTIRRSFSNNRSNGGVLVLNCGSSSVKYEVVSVHESSSARGTRREGRTKGTIERLTGREYSDCVREVLREVCAGDSVRAVGHRFVNGGSAFSAPLIVTDEAERQLQDLFPLAPLHNPHNLRGIQLCKEVFPNVDHVAVFDTAFHNTIPPHVHLYPLPLEISLAHRIRKYGFHGISYSYVSDRLYSILSTNSCDFRERDQQAIIFHLGSGCSAAAVSLSFCPVDETPKYTCRDTTMGFTPLGGLMMATRCGSLDPSVIGHLSSALEGGMPTIMDILNKKSGLLGVSGLSHDFRDVVNAAYPNGSAPDDSTETSVDKKYSVACGMRRSDNGDRKEISRDGVLEDIQQRCVLALDMFAHQAAREMLALVAALPGPLNAIVFTGGIGENSSLIRKKILSHLKCFESMSLDDARNERNDEVISTSSSSIMLLVVPTDEELQIARETLRVVGQR